MGRAERRKFFHKHPYCSVCERNGIKKVKATNNLVGVALCDACFDRIVNAIVNTNQDEEVTENDDRQDE